MSDYSIHRRDQTDRVAGGVCMYAHTQKVQNVERLHELEEDIEAICLKINVAGLPKSLIVGSIYRPPNTPTEPFLRNLDRCLRHKRKMGDHLTILAGDFNSRNSNAIWYNEDLTDEAGDHESLHQLFCALNLEQQNHFLTNIYAGQLRSCLDLVATDIPSLHTRGIDPPGVLGPRDHRWKPTGPSWSRRWDSSEPQRSLVLVKGWHWRAQKRNKLDQLGGGLEAEDVSRAGETWKDKILDIAQRHIPKCIVSNHSSGQRPWITAAIRHETQAKHRLFREYKRSRLPAAWLALKQQCNKSTPRSERPSRTLCYRSHLRNRLRTVEQDCQTTVKSLTYLAFTLHQLLAVFKMGKSSFIRTMVDASRNPMESGAEKLFLRQTGVTVRIGCTHKLNSFPSVFFHFKSKNSAETLNDRSRRSKEDFGAKNGNLCPQKSRFWSVQAYLKTMLLNFRAGNILAGCVQIQVSTSGTAAHTSPSGANFFFWNACVTVHDCKVAPLKSQVTAYVVFRSLFDKFLFRFLESDINHRILQKRSAVLQETFVKNLISSLSSKQFFEEIKILTYFFHKTEQPKSKRVTTDVWRI